MHSLKFTPSLTPLSRVYSLSRVHSLSPSSSLTLSLELTHSLLRAHSLSPSSSLTLSFELTHSPSRITHLVVAWTCGMINRARVRIKQGSTTGDSPYVPQWRLLTHLAFDDGVGFDRRHVAMRVRFLSPFM